MSSDAEPFIFWETLVMPAGSLVLVAVVAWLAVIVAGVAWGVRRRPRRPTRYTPSFVVSRVYTAEDLAEIVELENALRLEWREDTRP